MRAPVTLAIILAGAIVAAPSLPIVAQPTPVVAPVPAAAGAGAAPATGRPIGQDDYDIWRSIQGARLSNDGAWTAYSLAPAVGDGELIIRSTRAATEYRVPRGYLGRPALTVSGSGAGPLPAAEFTADSRWVVALTYAPMAEFEQARRAKKKPADQPKASLAIVSVADGGVVSVPQVKSFRLPRRQGGWLAYLLEAADSVGARSDSGAAAAPNVAAATPGGAPRPVAGDTARAGARKKATGATLVVRELATGAELRLADVTDYIFDEQGRWLAYAVSSADSARDGAYVRDLRAGRELTLLAGPGSYKQLAFDRSGAQLAFVSDRDDRSASRPRYSLYHSTLPAGRTAKLVAGPELGSGEIVSDRANVSFVKSGGALTFGLAPAPLDSIPADSLADRAVFDLWHYKDPRLQPEQILQAGRDRDRSYTAVVQLAGRKLVRLGNDTLQRVTLSDDGRKGLAVTSVPYSVEAMWGEGGSDVILLDAATGARTLVAERVPFGAQLSPGGRYVLWFADGGWHSYAVESGRRVELTRGLDGVRFDQETWDTPSTPAPWGVGGWTTGDELVLLYDRYDVWEVDPSGRRAPRNLTDSVGRRGELVMRVVNLDPDGEPLDAARPLLLRVMDDRTKATGFYEDRIGAAAEPRRVLMGDRRYGTPARARDAEVFMLTQETVREFPDLWVGPALTQLTRVSDANPQQGEYRWADVELVSWRSLDGVELKGLLYKPDGFDPSRKYPMVVYFYEQLSDNRFNYVVPAGRNVVNPVVYASQGYLVFEPDIAYTTGYPGQSALHSIVPGVQSLIARGFVDPDAVASAGQSWGGYQTAYMITQTNIFRAAMAGAPVANMTSAYGGIRWGSGVARAFQYEKTQSRIGGSIWEYPMRYIENSPLFFADRVQTPLLIMHNDGDGAVPWYQGIELFVALRRFGKEVYMFNYNGDDHNPRKRANQKDIDMRMLQFFGHHLKGEPMPDWMRDGIPFLQKGRDQLAPATVGGESAPPVVPGAPSGTTPGAVEGRP